MPSRLPPGLLIVCGLMLSGATWTTVDSWASAPARGRAAAKKPTKLTPPPKWDRAVLETFATDARQRLGAGPIPGTAPAATAETTPSPNTSGPAAKPAATSASGWSALIATSTLEDEVKALGQSLATAVQSQTGFKGGAYRTAREDFTMLAVLFAVIGQYDGEVRWQKDAPSLRMLFARAGFNCKVGTDNSYNEAKQRSQDLADLLRGQAIEARPADNDFQWPEVANRPPLMKRMEKSLRERLSPWTSNSTEFTKNRQAILREAQLLALLARVIRTEGYEYADDATYREYVDQLEKQCLEIIEAAQNSELPKAQSATSQMNKTCDACHADFRAG